MFSFSVILVWYFYFRAEREALQRQLEEMNWKYKEAEEGKKRSVVHPCIPEQQKLSRKTMFDILLS